MIKKKYLFVIPSFNYGGAEKVMINFANQASLMRNVTVLVMNNKGDLKKNLNKKINIYSLKNQNIIFKFIDLIKFIKKKKFDFIITSILHINVIFCILKFFLLKEKTKVIIRPSNTLKSNSPNIILNLKFLIFKLLSFKFYKYADKVISIDNSIYELLIKNYNLKKKKIIKINNPTLDLNIINKLKNKKINNQRKKFILSIGSLTKQKNFGYLLKLYNKFEKKKLYDLIIIGDGYELNFLLNYKKKKKLHGIKILKKTDNPYKYMKKCNLFISTSLWEGQPNAIIEAAYLSKRVMVTTNNASVKKILKLRNNCIIDTSNSEVNLLKKINVILKKKTKLKSTVYHKYSTYINTKKLVNHVEKS